ncbi:hypothetical protein [Holophaga foetida]|uniref:hypothetical protein n=1 Tax=Holophaga foetida TaxID=35839 RepID=UPI0002471C24|nr:hypothetical protein [Holophaga foetida]
MPLNLPTLGEFQEAILHPPSAFRMLELQGLHPALNRMGKPLSWSGAFGIVFRMEGGSSFYAVKVFTQEIRDLVSRYHAYQTFLERCPQDFKRHLTGSLCLEQGFLVRGRPQPCIVMPWIEGKPLNDWVIANVAHRERLRWLQGQLRRISRGMGQTGFSHGDLQHGNLLVTEQALVMVDYDNLTLPGMPALPSTTSGVPGYRHPQGGPGTALACHDRFALLESFIALEALMRAPELLRGRMGEDFMLFQAEDLRNPQRSPLFQGMSRDSHLRPWADLLMKVCQEAPDRTPELDKLLARATFPEALPPVPASLQSPPVLAAGPVPQAPPSNPEANPFPAAPPIQAPAPAPAHVPSSSRSGTAYGCGCFAFLLLLLFGGVLGLRSCFRSSPTPPPLHAQLEGELKHQLVLMDGMRDKLKPLLEAPKDAKGNLLQGAIPASIAPRKPRGLSDQAYLLRLSTLLEIQVGACAQAQAVLSSDRKHPDSATMKTCLAQIDGLPDDVKRLLVR